MKKIIQSVKGTRDFYPEEMSQRTWLLEKIKQVSERYGYQEYDGPFIEKIDLYAAKSGEELVKEQAFVFQDRGGDLITLRPELTPSLARMIAQKQQELIFPQRWWSFGPFWRYERPQKGRTREFFQWNIDLLGSDSPESDAELVAIAANFFESLGLSSNQVKIYINNRKLMDSSLEKIGIEKNKKQDVFRLIDRRDKMPPMEWDSLAINYGLFTEQLANLKMILSDGELWQQSDDMVRLFNALDAMGVSDYVKYDAKIIRGLDYYTGLVFEARDIDGEGRALLGGGHYDNLVADVGGDPLPGVGFAMGDVMMGIVLKKYGCIPEFKNTSASVLMTVFDENLLLESLKIAGQLRNSGINVVSFTDVPKLQKQLKFADRIGVQFVLIYGPDEVQNQTIILKDLSGRSQESIALGELTEILAQKLA